MFGFGFDMEGILAGFGGFYYWMGSSASGKLLSACMLVLAGFVLKELLRFALCKTLNFLLMRKITYEQERAFRAIAMPISFVPVVAGVYFALDSFVVPGKILFYTRALVKSLVAFNATWFLFALVEPVALALKKRDSDKTKGVIIAWGVRVAKFIIMFVGMSVVLEHWGVKVVALLASLGVIGIAVALGAQDMFRNIISGVTIISEKRFNVGDIVKTEGANPIEGIVENIGFRSTMIRKFDKAPMYVPNNTLADAAVVNFSSRLYRRIEWFVRLEYRTSAQQLKYIRQTIEDYMLANPEFVKPPEALLQVRIDRFGESSVDLLIYCFTNTNVWVEFLRIKENLLLRIKEVVEEAGARFAIPASSVYVEKLDHKMARPELPKDLMPAVARRRARSVPRRSSPEDKVTFLREDES